MSSDRAVRVFVGWDSREAVAAQVCEYSIKKNSTVPVRVRMLQQQSLRDQGIYTRPPDHLGSTEFTFTRFLVPHLMKYRGWAVFCDCDFLWLGNIQELINQADDRYAVMVVKHDYRPQNTVKMDGCRQEYYPRKNWSSMILFNCGHPSNRRLTPDHVNSASGQELHRFAWLADEEIGSLAPEWNWLVGWYHSPWDGSPRALHYTEGGPWFDNYSTCEYASTWMAYRAQMEQSQQPSQLVTLADLSMPPTTRNFLQAVLDHMQDPFQQFGKITGTLEECIREYQQGQLVGLSDPRDPADTGTELPWDPVVHAFSQGAAGCMATWDTVQDLGSPLAFRSIAKKRIMHQCLSQGRNFYYIDTGYFGNGKRKHYHRVTLNAMQWLGPIEDRPPDRLELTGVAPKICTPGSKILLAPPSQKAMSYWDLDLDQWIATTIATIQQHTDRPIVVRTKPPRTQRATVDTMEMALQDDVHALVTFNSIAAVEALILGKPVFVMGPNAAHLLANHDLSQIENPFCPDLDQVYALLRCLAYHQFTTSEMSSGYAWQVLQGQA